MARTKAADPSSVPYPAVAGGPKAHICVIFTDVARTRAALLAAVQLGRGLDLQLRLLAACRVPFPLPLEEPPISIGFTEDLMFGLVSDLDTEVAIQILLCREPEAALREALGPETLVVIGTPKSWWRSQYRNLALRLKADGRNLVLID